MGGAVGGASNFCMLGEDVGFDFCVVGGARGACLRAPGGRTGAALLVGDVAVDDGMGSTTAGSGFCKGDINNLGGCGDHSGTS